MRLPYLLIHDNIFSGTKTEDRWAKMIPQIVKRKVGGREQTCKVTLLKNMQEDLTPLYEDSKIKCLRNN